jgi:hypothetical protein
VAKQKNVIIVLNKIRKEVQTQLDRMEMKQKMLSGMGLPASVDTVLALDVEKTKRFIQLVDDHISENTTIQDTTEGGKDETEQGELSQPN